MYTFYHLVITCISNHAIRQPNRKCRAKNNNNNNKQMPQRRCDTRGHKQAWHRDAAETACLNGMDRTVQQP